jgi:hypothetical protein
VSPVLPPGAAQAGYNAVDLELQKKLQQEYDEAWEKQQQQVQSTIHYLARADEDMVFCDAPLVRPA